MAFPKSWGTFFAVPTINDIVFWDPCCGPSGEYHVGLWLVGLTPVSYTVLTFPGFRVYLTWVGGWWAGGLEGFSRKPVWHGTLNVRGAILGKPIS